MGNERLRGRMQPAGLTRLTWPVPSRSIPRRSNAGSPTVASRSSGTVGPCARLSVPTKRSCGPRLLDDERARAASRAEVRTVYPNRGAVPADLWRRLIEESSEQVDVLVYAGLFLIDSHPHLPTSLAERAADGLQARLLYGDPESEVVTARGEEEGIRDNLAARIQLSLTYIEPAIGDQGRRGSAAPNRPLQLPVPVRRRDAGQHPCDRCSGGPKPSPSCSAARRRPPLRPLPAIVRPGLDIRHATGRPPNRVTT